MIPLTLSHRKGLELDGSYPALLHAYGAYGMCLDAGFNPERLGLLRRGYVLDHPCYMPLLFHDLSEAIIAQVLRVAFILVIIPPFRHGCKCFKPHALFLNTAAWSGMPTGRFNHPIEQSSCVA